MKKRAKTKRADVRTRKPGAPTKLTPQLQRTFTPIIKLSGFYRDACAAVGISEETLADWRRRGAAGDQPYAGFSEALKKAEIERRQNYLKESMQRGAKKNDAKEIQWRAAVTDPETFSVKHHVVFQQEIDHAIDRLKQEFRNEPYILERAIAAIAGQSSGGGVGGDAPQPQGALAGGVGDAHPGAGGEGVRAATALEAAPGRAGEDPAG
jgi:hypothetical protein